MKLGLVARLQFTSVTPKIQHASVSTGIYDSIGLGGGLRISISNKFPDDADTGMLVLLLRTRDLRGKSSEFCYIKVPREEK